MIGQNLIQHICRIMEGKTCVVDSSLCFHFCKKLKSSPLLHFLHAFLAHRMKQIKINIILIKPLKLLVKNILCIFLLLKLPYRQLGCKIICSSVILVKNSSKERFAVTVMIRICRVIIINSGCHSEV